MRYPFVLLDVGETLIGPRESFGSVYARVHRDLGFDVPPGDFEKAVREVWQAMEQRVPVGADRYSHFPGGEDEYWLRFVVQAQKLVLGTVAGQDVALAALTRLRNEFRGPGAWKVYDDVVPVLERLRAQGVRLAVASNWDSRLPQLLDTLDLSRFFETIAVSHLEGLEKPAPEFFLRVLEKLDAAPADALHVGDTPEHDLVGARAAGIDAILIDRKHRFDGPAPVLRELGCLDRIAVAGLEHAEPGKEAEA